jgi:hypothetical protein
MKIFIIVCLIVIAGVIQTHAQAPMLQVLNTTGASTTTGSTGVIVEYSIGEPMTLTANPSGSISVTQGFEQPFYGVVNTAEAFDEKYTFKCYPNPVNELLNIETDFKGFQEYRIFSMNGELVTSGKFDYTPIHLSSLPFGSYILTFSSKNQSLTKSINIIKQ